MMFKEIVLVALAVVVAHCAPQALPIAKQGKDFPVPIVDEKTTDDFFDDRFYPDIDDEGVGPKAPTGTQKTPGSKGPGGRTPPGRGGQGGKTGGKDQKRGPATGRNPPKTGGKGTEGKELRIREKTPPEKQGKGNRKNLSSYKNAQPKLIFKSSQFNANGKFPYAVRLFKTKKSEEVIAIGNPTDEFILELLDGKPDNLSLRIETMGQTSKAILKNPNRNRLVGRVKSYNGAYSG